jgi:prepilin-type N-terminal cleavage/methylation domain-containing protein
MKRAFSLIELLIVIVIIGVLYTLSINNFKTLKNKDEKLTLKTLKRYMQNIPHEKSVKILCTQNCLSCDFYVDTKIFLEKKISEDFLDNTTKVYRYSFSSGMVDVIYPNNICFSYTIDKKGVGEQIFVESRGLVYDFTTYLHKTKVYKSIDDVVEMKDNLIQEILR